MSNLSRALSSLVVLVALMAAPLTAFAEVRIAVVDIQKALVTVKEGQEARKKLEKMAKEKKARLEKLSKEVQKLEDELEHQAQLMKEDVRRKKLMAYQQKVQEAQKALMESQQALAQKEQELTQPIVQKLMGVAEEMAKELGYDIVLERSAVVYAQGNMDLTDELIKRYNLRYSSRGKSK